MKKIGKKAGKKVEEDEEESDQIILSSQINEMSEADFTLDQLSEEGSSDDGEGSLEDAIANLSNIKSPYASLSSASNSGSDFDSEYPMAFQTIKKNILDDDNDDEEFSDRVVTVDSLGFGLPINVREALRYRIRKKM